MDQQPQQNATPIIVAGATLVVTPDAPDATGEGAQGHQEPSKVIVKAPQHQEQQPQQPQQQPAGTKFISTFSNS